MKQFKILQKDGKARVGKLQTAHGVIETPNFIPVGTQGTVKALTPRDLEEIGVQIVLANTYHLMLRPGADLIEKLGGLHKFMNWDRPIMTDSGGFQVFSLGVGLESGESKVLNEDDNFKPKQKIRLAKITEEGVIFQSHIDGTKHFLTPEESIKTQHQLGADLIVSFDDHESSAQSYEETLKSLELTERWGIRSLKAHKNHLALLYGVVHGGLYQDLRVRSAKFTDEYFDAIAIGGIYGTRKDLYQIVDWAAGAVSEGKPRHLLGIGEIEDLFNGVERGIDLFDCVTPTRRARNGSLYVSSGDNRSYTINIRSAKYVKDSKPIDPHCSCYTCLNFSKAYLRHLYFAKEILFHTLATYHNIYFINHLMKQIREAIKNNQFNKRKGAFLGLP